MRRAQSGQAIVLIAVMLGVLVGMAALAIDGSRAYALRRDLQSAVDGAALAAADNYQRTNSYASAESAAATSFGVSLRLYSAPSCTPLGSPGPGTFTVTCTYPDGTVLTDVLPVRGAQGAMFQLTASQTLSLQFARILTNGTSPTISSTSASRVNNLLYSPTVAALAQAGCGGAGGTAVSVNGAGSLKLGGDLVSSGTISVSTGSVQVAGDIYARCQSSVAGASTYCYPSGSAPACTYPDVVGVVRSGYHFTDPNYPPPSPIGGAQAGPGSSVVLLPGVYAVPVSIGGGRCYFLAGGVYNWSAGFTNVDDLVSNELKPPDEPNAADNTRVATPQFWNSVGIGCAGHAQFGTTSAGNGNGNCQGNCQNQPAVPPGAWSFVLTSTRTDTYNGVAYKRESAPSMCYQVNVGDNQDVTVKVSNVPGATAYNIYAAPPGNGCAGPFGFIEPLPVTGSVLNTGLSLCPAVTGTGCSLGHTSVILDTTDLGPPFAPNGTAAPGVVGAYPPRSEIAPLAAGLPNQNPRRAPGVTGDRANENSCESLAGPYVTCPGAVTPGAVVFYLPSSSGCLNTAATSDTFVFSGYQYNWISVYEPGQGSPPANTCSDVLGGYLNSAFVGLVYVPASSLSISSSAVFEVSGTGGVIANTVSFTGTLPAITFNAAYAPVPFAARLVS
jgi:hypothetical protein